MKKVLRESMTKFRLPDRTIRIWRQEQDAHQYSPVRPVVLQQAVCTSADTTIDDMALALVKLPGVNAVEVVDLDGNGVVLYADWP